MLARPLPASDEVAVLPECPDHPGSRVRPYRSHGPNGPGVYPQCLYGSGQSHLLPWSKAALPTRALVVSSPLSPSEHEVLIDAAEGLTVTESAARRVKGPETVKTQRKQVLLKLSARNMAQAVALAMGQGLIPVRRAA